MLRDDRVAGHRHVAEGADERVRRLGVGPAHVAQGGEVVMQLRQVRVEVAQIAVELLDRLTQLLRNLPAAN